MNDRATAGEAAASRLRLGGCVLDLAQGDLLGTDGRPAPLRRQALEVLLVLGRQANQVVTKDELMRLVWPDVVVGDGSLAAAVADIRRVLGDGDHRLVRNVARRGYMLVPEAEPPAGAPHGDGVAAHPLEAAPHAAAPSRRVLFALLGGLSAMGVGAAWFAAHRPAGPAATAPPAISIVVLPLGVEGDAADTEWFADALLGDVIAEVSRLHGSLVIGRDTALTYKGRELDPRVVARELAVRWVVRGNVRYADNRVRLSVALLDGETGAQRWADSFDAERASLRLLLDEFVQTLARLLVHEVYRSNAARAQRLSPQQITADDLAMQGIALWLRGFTRENVLQANELFERAVALDPKSQHGWGGINYTTLHALSNGWLADPAAGQRRLAEVWARLEQLDPDSFYGYQARVTRAYSKQDWPAMLALTQAWTERHRHALAYPAHGGALIFNDRPDDAVEALERALRISPREAFRVEWQYRLALAHYIAGRYDKARDWGLTAQRTNAGLTWPPIHAAALLELGDRNAAQQAFDEFAARHPEMDAAAVVARLPGTTPRYVAARDRLVAALRSLGLR